MPKTEGYWLSEINLATCFILTTFCRQGTNESNSWSKLLRQEGEESRPQQTEPLKTFAILTFVTQLSCGKTKVKVAKLPMWKKRNKVTSLKAMLVRNYADPVTDLRHSLGSSRKSVHERPRNSDGWQVK